MHIYMYMYSMCEYMYMYLYMKTQVHSAERKKVQTLDSCWAYGPHQQGAAQSLPGTTGIK